MIRFRPTATATATVLAVAALTAAAPAPVRAESCNDLIGQFNRAVDAGRDAEAQGMIDRIATDASCGQYQIPVERRLAAFRLAQVQALMARGRPAGEYERLLIAADRPHVLWQAAATLAEVRFGERRFGDSALAFDRAIEIIKNERLTPTAPSKFDIQSLFERAGQARLLAANAHPGESKKGFVKTARNTRDGLLGGLYSPSVRGIVPVAIPVPITFEFNQTQFTPVGEEAAQELATAIREQHPAQIVLVGHTDVRGGEKYNLELSKARAETVAKYLHDKGVDSSIKTVGKGSTDPMHLIDTSGLSQDDIYALNRRVEWRRQ